MPKASGNLAPRARAKLRTAGVRRKVGAPRNIKWRRKKRSPGAARKKEEPKLCARRPCVYIQRTLKTHPRDICIYIYSPGGRRWRCGRAPFQPALVCARIFPGVMEYGLSLVHIRAGSGKMRVYARMFVCVHREKREKASAGFSGVQHGRIVDGQKLRRRRRRRGGL